MIHQAHPDKIVPMMSKRFRYKEVDGAISDKASSLEVAIDSHWYEGVPRSFESLVISHFNPVVRSSYRPQKLKTVNIL